MSFRYLHLLAFVLLPPSFVAVPLFVAVLAFVAAPALAESNPPEKIAWYGTLESGLAVAKSSNRPILVISGAPHCHGVPGIW